MALHIPTPPGPGELRVRLIPPVILLFLLGGISLSVVLFVVTQHQDRTTREESERIVAALLARETTQLGTVAKDYAYRDAAVENLVISLNETWADNNVGSYLTETHGVSSSYVVTATTKLSARSSAVRS